MTREYRDVPYKKVAVPTQGEVLNRPSTLPGSNKLFFPPGHSDVFRLRSESRSRPSFRSLALKTNSTVLSRQDTTRCVV
jgi:hypothetical protein